MIRDEQTRLFFVVVNNELNPEIFETLEQADEYAQHFASPKIAVGIVKHTYQEDSGGWNYDDQADTFKYIHNIQ